MESEFADFYATFATVSLTVTGLWMFIATVRFREWTAARDPVAQATSVSLQLAAPGVMCLFALIEPGSNLLWRVAFGVLSAVSAAVLLRLPSRSRRGWPAVNALGNWVAVALFAAVTIVAVAPALVSELTENTPRRAEFFLFAVLLVDGLVVAWTMLFADVREVAGAGAGEDAHKRL